MVLIDTVQRVSRNVSRRRLLEAAAAGIVAAVAAPGPGFGASRFWETKLPSQWTADQIAELVSSSPWAKQVSAQYRTALEGLQPGREGQPQQGRGEATVGECGLVPCGNIMPGKVTVIWESAQPIREALHAPIPAQFNGRYVLSVRGLETEEQAERLRDAASLSAKGKPPALAGLVGRRNNTWLFGFSKELLPLAAADKDVEFSLKTGANLSSTLVRAVFQPKDMVYRGELAV